MFLFLINDGSVAYMSLLQRHFVSNCVSKKLFGILMLTAHYTFMHIDLSLAKEIDAYVTGIYS